MSFSTNVWRCKDGVSPPCKDLGHVYLSWASEQFKASTGDVLTLDRVLPGEGLGNNADEGVSPELGFAVLPGEQYVVSFYMLESDDRCTNDAEMGEAFHVLDTDLRRHVRSGDLERPGTRSRSSPVPGPATTSRRHRPEPTRIARLDGIEAAERE